MKNIIIAMFAIGFLFSSCKDEAKEVADYAILSGKVENLKGGTIWMLNFDGWQKYINVKEDGTFLDTIRIEKPGAYLIDFEKKRSEIYVINGTNIQFNFDAKNFVNTIKFEGDYASLNNHFATKAIAQEAYFLKMKELYVLEAEDCRKTLQENYVSPFLISLEEVTGISEELRNLEKRNIQIGYIEKLAYFKSYHPRYTNKENYIAPDWFEKEVNDFSIDDTALLQYSTEYFRRVSSYYSSKGFELMKNDSTLSYSDAYFKTMKSIENEAVKNTLLFSNFRNYISTSKNKKEKFADYLAINTDSIYKERATALYQQVMKLEPGSPSPKFVNYENHAGGTTSLNEFKGKYVYIDIWATWCGPCKRQIPYLEKIEEQYHDKNIAFVTISVDYKKDYDKWKQMVTDKKMKGIQLIAPDAFNSEFIDAFNIQGIPRFILIDPDGNLITPNAPMPEQRELIDLFNKHNI